MANLVENAIRIKNAFDDIKEAIVNKGGQIQSDSIEDYPDAIDGIDNYIRALSAQYNEGILWYGGNSYVTSSSSLVQFVPSMYTNIGGQIGIRSLDNKSVTIQKAGIYLVLSAICDQGYNSATSSTANRGNLFVRVNNVQKHGTIIEYTAKMNISSYSSLLTLNVGDVITLYMSYYAGSNRRIGGGVSFMRLGDVS